MSTEPESNGEQESHPAPGAQDDPPTEATDASTTSTRRCKRCGKPFSRSLTVGIGGSIGHDGESADRTCFKPITESNGDPAIRLWWHTAVDLEHEQEHE